MATGTWDKHTNKRIDTLHPLVRGMFLRLIMRVDAELGIKLRLTDYLRTWKQQDDLYALGRTKHGKIVTWVKGGGSAHNYGLAGDVCQIKNGKAIWNMRLETWRKIAIIANEEGLDWGYDLWKKDKPHFQVLFNYTIRELFAKFTGGEVDDDDYVLIKEH